MRHVHQALLGVFSLLAVLVIAHSFSAQFDLAGVLMEAINPTKNTQNRWTCALFRARCPPTAADAANSEKARFFRPPPSFWGRELDPSFSNVVNSVFPIDSIISYNASNSSATSVIIARYASFSPVLSDEIRGNYAFISGSACSEIDPHTHPDYSDKILIVQRGKCTFVKKLNNIDNASLKPRAVIIANNVPRSGLITMYSKTFNRDEELRFPILFMTYEDYEQLYKLRDGHVVLAIRTASFDGFIGLVLSMAVSPPLMILACYLIVRGMQLYSRRRRNRLNQRYVKSLPVHIYNKNHLIPTASFYDYLVQTHQTSDIPSVSSSTDDIPVQEFEAGTSYVIGGTDLYSLGDMDLLFGGADFYATQKCSICLARFVPLKSRVLVLGCKHIYHEKCLSNWLINFRKTCPLCNETLQVRESQPFFEHASDYGTFGADLERREPDMEDVSNTAVRSLQVESVASEPINSVPTRANNRERESSLLGSQSNSPYEVFSDARVSTSDSFVTTKSQQSLGASVSSYHTSTEAAPDSDGDTQSYESSRSTLRFQ